MVLRGGERHVGLTVTEHVIAHLFTDQALFDEHLVTGSPELPATHHPIDGVAGLVGVRCHDHAFAGGEAIGFDHERARALADICVCGVGVGEHAERCGGDAVARHTLLAEHLGAFETRRVGPRPERGDPRRFQAVDQAAHQRRLGSDHDQGDLELLGQRLQARQIVDVHGMVRGELRDARVPRRDVHLRAIALEAPRERMLARARSHH